MRALPDRGGVRRGHRGAETKVEGSDLRQNEPVPAAGV
jgi:hypothetical protein